MKHWRRILFNVVAAQSLLFAVVSAVFWARSYQHTDMVYRTWPSYLPLPDKPDTVLRKSVDIYGESGNGEFLLLMSARWDDTIAKDNVAAWKSSEPGWWSVLPPTMPSWPLEPTWYWGAFGVGSKTFANGMMYMLRFPAWSAFVLWLVLPSVWLVRRWREAKKGGTTASA